MELFSQAGMEQCCRKFVDRIRAETDARGPSFNAQMAPRYVSCDFEARSLRVAFTVEPWMRNPMEVMHGGAVAGALDLSMGSLTFFCSGEFLTPTVTMTVSYERPIPVGRELLVEAQCLSCGKSMAYAMARAWDPDRPEKILSSGTGTYYTASGMR